MKLYDRLLSHAQALENQALHADQRIDIPTARARRVTANLLREAAAELKNQPVAKLLGEHLNSEVFK
jgi:hypothetical protein